MNTLITYVDNTFSGIPQTEEIQTLKRKILTEMESQYNQLKLQGKSEDEIVGLIISNFSDISKRINEHMRIQNENEIRPDIITNAPIRTRDNRRLIRAIMNSYWIIVVTFYLLISFTFHIWNISWIIFLIAAAVNRFCHSYFHE